MPWGIWDNHPCQQWDKAECLSRFLSALRNRDSDSALECMHAMDRLGCWREALEGLISGPSARQIPGEAVLWFWTTDGFHISDSLKGDRILETVLKTLLPPYRGPGLTLYRGEAVERHRAGIYGMSWTTDLETARTFAQRRERGTPGGVLLELEASSDMIFCSPTQRSIELGEYEYLVDPLMIGQQSPSKIPTVVKWFVESTR
jgi:hypothetical protein